MSASSVRRKAAELRHLPEVSRRVAEVAAPRLEVLAKEECPVRTGATRDSITVVAAGDQVIANATTRYAEFVDPDGAVPNELKPSWRAVIDAATREVVDAL
jgi:hypothetical protein